MKTNLLLGPVVVLCLAGCGDSSNKPAPPASTNAATGGNLATAPVDYLNSAAKAQHASVKTLDVAALNKALEMFNVQEGRYPTDLNELVQKRYVGEMPIPPFGSRIVYDATAGTVKVEKQ